MTTSLLTQLADVYYTNLEIPTVLFAASLLLIYEKVPDKFTPLLPRFLQMVQAGGIEATIVIQLFGEVAKRSPEVLFVFFAPSLKPTKFIIFIVYY